MSETITHLKILSQIHSLQQDLLTINLSSEQAKYKRILLQIGKLYQAASNTFSI